MRSTPGRAVELGAALLHRPGDVGVGGRSLEDHVLEQVGHAGLAVALMPRADQDRQVDRDLGRDGSGNRSTRRPLSSRYSVIPSTDVTFWGSAAWAVVMPQISPAPWRKANEPLKCEVLISSKSLLVVMMEWNRVADQAAIVASARPQGFSAGEGVPCPSAPPFCDAFAAGRPESGGARTIIREIGLGLVKPPAQSPCS